MEANPEMLMSPDWYGIFQIKPMPINLQEEQ